MQKRTGGQKGAKERLGLQKNNITQEFNAIRFDTLLNSVHTGGRVYQAKLHNLSSNALTTNFLKRKSK